jgi:hypothetical protein
VADPPPRTLADVLAGAVGPVAVPADDAGQIAHLRDRLDEAARAAAGVAGWTPDAPLRLTKSVVTWLLRCPRRALAPPDSSGSDDVVAGLIVDAAAKLATLVPQRAATVEAAVAFLAATGDDAVADHLASLAPAARGFLLADSGARVAQLAAVWPVVEPDWWPRVEEPVRARLADGVVTVGGRLDLAFGGPPTPRPAVVVEVKGGRWYDGMRSDAHLYALLVALRDGRSPAAAVTVVADGTTQVEPIRPALLAHAAERLDEAMQVAAALAVGEAPDARPGAHCDHCPVRAGCPAGASWRATGVPA